MTAADLPQPVPLFGPVYADRPVLAGAETKFFGEPVAAVAADNKDAAEDAASLIHVDHEQLPAVLTIDAALDPASPLVQDAALRKPGPLAATNTLEAWQFGWGNLRDAHAECVIEHDYVFPMVTHFAIEPHAFLAAPDEHGVTIWSPIQHPYVLQRVVAAALKWPLARVRIIAPDPGGGFGGKGWPKFEPLMAFLALRAGRPVRLVLTLEETFQAVRRTSARVRARTGFDRSGAIVFQDLEANFLIGAYADIGARVVSKASYCACGPYKTPHARIVARAAEAIGWAAPISTHRGRGVAIGLKSSSTASASFALARMHYDASVTILSGTSDMGQGARTVLAQIVAEALGIPVDRVAMIMGDTSVVPFDSSTSASRSTVFMGNPVLKACESIKTQLRTIAAATFRIAEASVVVDDGLARMPGRDMTYAELLHAHFGPPRGELIGVGEERNAFDASHPLGGKPSFWEMMCAAVEVDVDVETGMVHVLRLVLVSDIGKALNPQQVEGQDEGAAVMGLGHTLMEHLILDESGRIRNLGSLDYRIPTIEDIPLHLESILIENADGPGPYGAKGAGEGGILAIAAA